MCHLKKKNIYSSSVDVTLFSSAQFSILRLSQRSQGTEIDIMVLRQTDPQHRDTVQMQSQSKKKNMAMLHAFNILFMYIYILH